MGNKRQFTDGFTLTELLSVVAAATVMAALLLSSLAGGKEQNQRANCRANLRQIYVTSSVYAGDNREALFTARPMSASGATSIQICLEPTPGLSGMAGLPDYATRPGLCLTNTGKTIWSCPNRPGFPVYQPCFADNENTAYSGQVVLGYQYFGGITTWLNDQGFFHNAPSPVKTTVSQPWWVLGADAMIYVDQAWGGSNPGDAEGQFAFANMPSHQPNTRPAGGNEVFMDGSAGWQKFDSMWFLTSWSTGGQRDAFIYQNPKDFPAPLLKVLNWLTPAALGE